MKIIRKDNFNRDDHSESVVAENVTEYYAKRIVKLLNKETGPDSSDFFKVEPDNYKPYVFEP